MLIFQCFRGVSHLRVPLRVPETWFLRYVHALFGWGGAERRGPRPGRVCRTRGAQALAPGRSVCVVACRTRGAAATRRRIFLKTAEFRRFCVWTIPVCVIESLEFQCFGFFVWTIPV